VDELGPDGLPTVAERDLDLEHLRDEVPVGELPRPFRPGLRRVDPHADRPDVRLEPDGVLDRPGEPARGPVPHRRPEVLVEHAAELDAGLEQECLAPRERGSVKVRRPRAHALPFVSPEAFGRATVKGPTK